MGMLYDQVVMPIVKKGRAINCSKVTRTGYCRYYECECADVNNKCEFEREGKQNESIRPW